MLRREFLAVVTAAPAAAQTGPFRKLQEVPAAAPLRPDQDRGPLAGRRWRLRWMFDEEKRAASIADFCCPAPGLAVAALQIEGDFRSQPAVVVTRDGGESWRQVELRDNPVSLYALNGAHLWLVGSKSLWYSAENGLEWTKRNLPKSGRKRPLYRVFFLDENRGWAFGAGKVFHQTRDGGATWSPVPESAEIRLTDENTAWTSMAFLDGKRGLITGFSSPQRDEMRLPGWMAPEQALRRRLVPATTVVGETHDGGASWKFSLTSAFGRVVRVRASGHTGLAISRYGENFEFPGEVYALDFRTGGSRPVFRRRDLRVDDAALLEGGAAVLAAIQPSGRLFDSPVPGRLRVFYSTDLNEWAEMKVDYRAEGSAAFLSAPAPGELWAATDSACVLRLV